jgi:hypothetical protein
MLNGYVDGIIKYFHVYVLHTYANILLSRPPIQRVPGTLSSGAKRQGREADYSSPVSVDVKKIWIYTSTLPNAFMA